METKKPLRDALKPFVLVRLQVPCDRNTPVAGRFYVSGVPRTVILDSDGQEIDRIAGWSKPKIFAAHIRKILSGNTFDRWFADYASRSEHSSVEIEECLRKLTNHGLYQQVVAVAAREPLYKLTEAARGLVSSARPRAFSNLYEEVAENARSTGWTKLELPQDPAGVIGVELKNLALPGNQGRLKTKEALRTALREARSADADRMLRAMAENARGWSAMRKLLWLAEKNGCRETVMFLVQSVTAGGVDQLKNGGQIYEMLKALIMVRALPELGNRLAERLLELDAGILDLALAARARYLAGHRKPALLEMERAQRSCLKDGALVTVHFLGEERRAMAEGRWAGSQPWIADWPKP